MMKTWTVYEHISPSGKVYVGISSNIENRWRANGYYYCLSDTPFARAIRKYGWDNFQHIILYQNLSKDEACIKELELIAVQKSLNNSYNVTDGGEGYAGKQSDTHVLNRVRSRINNNKTKILLIDKDFNYIEFNSKREVDNYLGVSKGVCGHILKQPIGYTCKNYYIIEINKEEDVDIEYLRKEILTAVNTRKQIQLDKNRKSIRKAIAASVESSKNLDKESRIKRYSSYGMLGKHHSQESKMKMSLSAKHKSKNLNIGD